MEANTYYNIYLKVTTQKIFEEIFENIVCYVMYEIFSIYQNLLATV